MAQNYSVVTQNRSVRVLGPTEVMDTEEVGIVTHPTGIFVEYGLPLSLWQTRAGFELLGSLAAGIEQMISEGLAVGGAYVQDYDANNLLVDYCEFTVQYTPSDGRPPQLVPRSRACRPRSSTARVRLRKRQGIGAGVLREVFRLYRSPTHIPNRHNALGRIRRHFQAGTVIRNFHHALVKRKTVIAGR